MAIIIVCEGSVDGVEKIIFGHNLTEWIIGMGFIDALRYVNHVLIYALICCYWFVLRWSTKCRCGCHSLDRFIQIDIDDIFVGARGTRMTSDDVEALIQSQGQLHYISSYLYVKHICFKWDSSDKLRNRISNFSYLLGYSGAFFLHGDDLEDEGDRMIIGGTTYNYSRSFKNRARSENRSEKENIVIQKIMILWNLGFWFLHCSWDEWIGTLQWFDTFRNRESVCASNFSEINMNIIIIFFILVITSISSCCSRKNSKNHAKFTRHQLSHQDFNKIIFKSTLKIYRVWISQRLFLLCGIYSFDRCITYFKQRIRFSYILCRLCRSIELQKACRLLFKRFYWEMNLNWDICVQFWLQDNRLRYLIADFPRELWNGGDPFKYRIWTKIGGDPYLWSSFFLSLEIRSDLTKYSH